MAWLTMLVDFIIIFMVLEIIGLAWWDRTSGRGVPFKDVRLNLFSGLALMAALRVAVSGMHPALIVLLLLAAGILHAGDILRRWRR